MTSADLAREMNLRLWARANYVPPEQRLATWHPIVLNEMQCRDSELAALQPHFSTSTRYVPLMPSPSENAGFLGL
jgi:hypothetical protein